MSSRIVVNVFVPPTDAGAALLYRHVIDHVAANLHLPAVARPFSSLLPPTPPNLEIVSAGNRNPTAGINKIELCEAHQLLAAGTDDGIVHLWDSRQGQSGGGRAVASLDLRDSVDAAAVAAAEATLGGFQVGRGRLLRFVWCCSVLCCLVA